MRIHLLILERQRDRNIDKLIPVPLIQVVLCATQNFLKCESKLENTALLDWVAQSVEHLLPVYQRLQV